MCFYNLSVQHDELDEKCDSTDLSSDNIVVNFRGNERVAAESAASLLHLWAWSFGRDAGGMKTTQDHKQKCGMVQKLEQTHRKSICFFYPNCRLRDKQLPPVDF